MIGPLVEDKKGAPKAVTVKKGAKVITLGPVDRGCLAKLISILEGIKNGETILLSQSFPKGKVIVITPSEPIYKALRDGLSGEVRVELEEGMAVIAVIGAGMRGVPGVAARVFSAVASRGVNIRAIMQGPSELSISFVVREEDATEAARAVHEVFRMGG